jgi:hypothetical protein
VPIGGRVHTEGSCWATRRQMSQLTNESFATSPQAPLTEPYCSWLSPVFPPCLRAPALSLSPSVP